MVETDKLRQQVTVAIRRLLSEQNRDPYSSTYGCFDRRYWSWKLIDYPEATFQRNVYPLAWLLSQSDSGQLATVEVLTEAVKAGLEFSTQIQHKDGSFDQAFPHEHSFGATAFLLHPLLQAYQIVRNACSSSLQESSERTLRHAADFLCRQDETHGHLANHLAGAVLALLTSARFFLEPRYEQRAVELLQRILANQSPEGWFLEYEGADPGYQTLCLYYLAQVYSLKPETELQVALERAIEFLAWFVHPDSTFGGEYGSRRTSIYYPGGLALLSREFPLAWRITRFMVNALVESRTITLSDIDMGNLAPLLSNYITVLEANLPNGTPPALLLPWEKGEVRQDFPEAGMYIRGTQPYYALIGVSNGGVVKIFDRERQRLIWNDGGYVGQAESGVYLTTQITDLHRPCWVTPSEIKLQTPFYAMLRAKPMPIQFVLLRLLNLTVMRSLKLGNWIKQGLVRLLISGKQKVPLQLTRVLRFEPERVIIQDVLQVERQVSLDWLEFGRPFVAIHMASARYFENFSTASSGLHAHQVDVTTLRSQGRVELQVVI